MQEITDYLRDIYRLYRGARNSRRVPGGRQRHDQIFEMIFKFSSSPVDDATVRRMLVELSSSGNNMVGALWTLLFIDRANAWDLIRSVEVSNVVGSGSQTRNRIYDLVFRDNNRFEFKNWSGTIGTVDMQDQVLRDLLRGPLRDTFYLFSGRLRQRFADDASFYTWFRDAVNDAIADPATASRYRPDQLNSIVDNWRAVDSPPSGESNLPLRVMIVEDPSLYRSPGPSPIDPIAQYLQNR